VQAVFTITASGGALAGAPIAAPFLAHHARERRLRIELLDPVWQHLHVIREVIALPDAASNQKAAVGFFPAGRIALRSLSRDAHSLSVFRRQLDFIANAVPIRARGERPAPLVAIPTIL